MKTTRHLRREAMKNQPTAKAEYARLRTEVDAQISQIQGWLEDHAIEFEIEGSANYGMVGDLGHASELLGQILGKE